MNSVGQLGNQLITFELSGSRREPMAVQPERLATLVRQFCLFANEINDEPIDLLLVGAQQGSWVGMFVAVAKGVHKLAPGIAIYSTILGVPLACLQLSGHGSAVAAEKDAELVACEVRARQFDQKQYRWAIDQLIAALHETGATALVIRAPSASATRIAIDGESSTQSIVKLFREEELIEISARVEPMQVPFMREMLEGAAGVLSYSVAEVAWPDHTTDKVVTVRFGGDGAPKSRLSAQLYVSEVASKAYRQAVGLSDTDTFDNDFDHGMYGAIPKPDRAGPKAPE